MLYIRTAPRHKGLGAEIANYRRSFVFLSATERASHAKKQTAVTIGLGQRIVTPVRTTRPNKNQFTCN